MPLKSLPRATYGKCGAGVPRMRRGQSRAEGRAAAPDARRFGGDKLYACVSHQNRRESFGRSAGLVFFVYMRGSRLIRICGRLGRIICNHAGRARFGSGRHGGGSPRLPYGVSRCSRAGYATRVAADRQRGFGAPGRREIRLGPFRGELSNV